MMTATQSHNAALPLDPVRARVAYSQPLTNAEKMQAEQTLLAPEPPARHRISLPHPVDIAYWVGCLGGACVLLLWAIR
jgi:hypothetical protein